MPAITVDISRTGYTGDLGYEIWMPAPARGAVWDALMERGQPFDIKPAGMLALDVARIEAGLLLIEVDFFSSKKAMIDAQKYSPYEMGLGRLVSLDKARFIGQAALREEHRARPREAGRRARDRLDRSRGDLREGSGCRRRVAATASRVAVPVYRGGRQVGRATSTTWSPVLKRMIALATVERPHYADGTRLQIEVTVEAVRHRVGATVVKTPFFNPPRKPARLRRDASTTFIHRERGVREESTLFFRKGSPVFSRCSHPPCDFQALGFCVCTPTIIRSNA